MGVAQRRTLLSHKPRKHKWDSTIHGSNCQHLCFWLLHLHCGWFASATLVNPKIFRRLAYDDCLVNEGKPLKTSHIIRFTYATSFMYPLGFKYAKFCYNS